MRNYKKILCIGILSAAASTSVFAETIKFPVGQQAGTFNCTLSNSGAVVKIDTHNLQINGGCSGAPYVKKDGHLEGVPSSVFEGFYFQIEKNMEREASIDLVPSAGEITCSTGHGDKSNSYGDGKYCLK